MCADPLTQVSSMQLMDNYCPYAAGLLCFLVPIFEPLGMETPMVKQHTVTLLNFPYTAIIVGVIALTAVLGLLVSLSTFLVIGATSSLTYNVVRLPLRSHIITFLVCKTALPRRCKLEGLRMHAERCSIPLCCVQLHWVMALPGTQSVDGRPLALQMGHLKTVIILAGGFVLFDEKMPAKKLAGVLLALVGIIWYSGLKMQKAGAAPAAPGKGQLPGKGPAKSPLETEPLVAKSKGQVV